MGVSSRQKICIMISESILYEYKSGKMSIPVDIPFLQNKIMFLYINLKEVFICTMTCLTGFPNKDLATIFSILSL